MDAIYVNAYCGGRTMAKRQAEALYKDAAQPVELRVRDLLSRMTLEEKLRQMVQIDSASFVKEGRFDEGAAKKAFGKLGVGTLQDPRQSPARNVEIVNGIQKYLTGSTRLGIPAMIISECLHGHMSQGATIFPQAIGLGSMWDVALHRRIAEAIAKEARAVGVAQALSPDLDLARDPRWGRVEETYGEDPYLVERLGVAYIRGIQGERPTVDREHLVVTLKHFAAHGSPEGGVNLAPVAVGPRELHSLYLQPFRAAVVEAGALSVMPAYSEFDGVPCSSSKTLLTEILRKQWGFVGYVYSDYGAIGMLHHFHRTACDMAEAGRQSLEAGMDLEAPSAYGFGDRLREMVEKGVVPMELIDRAAGNVLRVKFLAGLFENPFAEKSSVKIVNCDEHRGLARRAAQESIVLLKNEKDLLPLDRNVGTIAVIGPNADVAQLGDYCIAKDGLVTPLAGIREAVGRKTKVLYARGCGIWEPSTEGFAEAVKIASEADVAVVVIGGASMITSGVGWGSEEKQPVATCGEGFDRTELGAPGVQQELVEAVVATGTPTVVVMVHGRPYSVEWIAEHVPAILDAWYPGEQGGHALADVLFGKVSPSGKLPISVPRSVGHVPVFYNHKPSARGYYHRPGSPETPGRDYVFSPPSPLWEFGFGLSYTTFRYSNLKVRPLTIAPGGRATVSVDVRNAGKREGREVVQLYVNDLVSSVTTPVKVLRGFTKITLRPGETQTVEFDLGPEDLQLLNEHFEWVVEPGDFEIMVGPLKKKLRVKA